MAPNLQRIAMKTKPLQPAVQVIYLGFQSFLQGSFLQALGEGLIEIKGLLGDHPGKQGHRDQENQHDYQDGSQPGRDSVASKTLQKLFIDRIKD